MGLTDKKRNPVTINGTKYLVEEFRLGEAKERGNATEALVKSGEWTEDKAAKIYLENTLYHMDGTPVVIDDWEQLPKSVANEWAKAVNSINGFNEDPAKKN